MGEIGLLRAMVVCSPKDSDYTLASIQKENFQHLRPLNREQCFLERGDHIKQATVLVFPLRIQYLHCVG